MRRSHISRSPSPHSFPSPPPSALTPYSMGPRTLEVESSPPAPGHQVLRSREGRSQRVSSQVGFERDLPPREISVVKGEAMIHGLHLVARPVGSEWRTRRPSQLIPTKF